MPPNFCPSCGGQVADRKTVECASCGHDFEDDVEFDDEVDEEDDDFFDDDEDDDSFTDTPTDDRPAQRKSTIEMSRSSVVQSTTTLAVPDGGQLHTSSSALSRLSLGIADDPPIRRVFVES